MGGQALELEHTINFIHYANTDLSSLCRIGNEISPRLPMALPILYTISKAISVGTKPIAKNIPASPRFIAKKLTGKDINDTTSMLSELMIVL